MSNSHYRYGLDYTGINPDNRIPDERHTTAEYRNGVIVPNYGPFFAESLIVTDMSSGIVLTRGQHYIVGEVTVEPTIHTGKEICHTIIMENLNVVNEFKIDYQSLGGHYLNVEPIISEHSGIVYKGPVDWKNIIDKPNKFPPVYHPHALEDVYGWEYLVEALERIRQAIIMSNIPAYEYLVEWVTDRLENIPDVTCRDIYLGDPIKSAMSYGMHQLSLRNQHRHRIYKINHIRKYTNTNPRISFRIITNNVPDGTTLKLSMRFVQGELTKVSLGGYVSIEGSVGVGTCVIPENIVINDVRVIIILENMYEKRLDICDLEWRGIDIPYGTENDFLKRCCVYRLNQPFSPIAYYLTSPK